MTTLKRTEIQFTRQGNIIFSLLAIYFGFFGYICGVYEENISYQLIFLDRLFISRKTWAAGLIIFVIISFMAFREEFYEYALRNTLYLILFTFATSFIWYWMVVGFDLKIFGYFFGILKMEPVLRIEGLVSILTVVILYYFSAFVGCTIKIHYKRYQAKINEFNHIFNEELDTSQPVITK